MITFVSAAFGIWLKFKVDRRTIWWTRTAWGLDQILSEDQSRQLLGMSVLTAQLREKAARREDGRMVNEIGDAIGLFAAVDDLEANIVEKEHHDETETPNDDPK